MVARRIELRDFRNYELAELNLPPGLTVVAGPNGAGKTNLLEALYFGCTARSPRTSNERELVRRGASVTRVVLDTAGEEEEHRIEVGFEPGESKRVRVDGSAVDSLSASERSRLAVFCYGRVHLNAMGLAIAARCDLDHLTAAAHSATAGRVIYDQSRDNFPTERPTPGRRVAITLATSVSRSLASRAAFASAENDGLISSTP